MDSYAIWSKLTLGARQYIIEASDAGVSTEELAKTFGLRLSSLERKLRLIRSTATTGLVRDNNIRRSIVVDGLRVMFYGDFHAPYTDRRAMMAVLAIAEIFQPELVVNLGDTLEADGLSHYDPGSNAPLLSEETVVWYEWAEALNEVLPSGARKFILRGNHDRRIHRALPRVLRGNPLVSLDSILKTSELGYAPVCDLLEINQSPGGGSQLYVTHGQFTSGSSGVAARKMSDRLAVSNVIVGHNHKSSYTTQRTPRGVVHRYEVGCMQTLQPSWDLYPDWTHSVLIGYIGRDSFDLRHVLIENGVFSLDGITYSA